MQQQYHLELFKAALSVGVAALSLLATWFVGFRLTASWNFRQRRRELDLASLQAFYKLYGELKELVKVWRLAKRQANAPVDIPSDERWKLLTRAAALEGEGEGLVLRLATERDLSSEEMRAIGLFRQALQSVRECVRDNEDCPLGSRGAEYRLLNRLAPEIASIAAAEPPNKAPTPQRAKDQLSRIVAINSDVWRQQVAVAKEAHEAGTEEDA